MAQRSPQSRAHILHIDPYRNETSRFADDHWQIKVGTDAALALCIGNEIFRLGGEDREYMAAHASGVEEYRAACAQWPVARTAEFCGIDANQIIELAERICSQPPLYVKVGYGMTRNEGGGNAMRAVSLLPALVGAWKHVGGGGGLTTSGGFLLNKSRYAGAHLLKPNRRHVNQNQLGRELANQERPIKALFVFNSNPMAVSPDTSSVSAGLSREDLFTVVLEHFQTIPPTTPISCCQRRPFWSIRIFIQLMVTIICNGLNPFCHRWARPSRIVGSFSNWPNAWA